MNITLSISELIEKTDSSPSGFFVGRKVGNILKRRKFRKNGNILTVDFNGIDTMSKEFIWGMAKALYARNYLGRRNNAVFINIGQEYINAINKTVEDVASVKKQPAINIDELIICPTCGIKTKLELNNGRWRWICSECGAYVGCHENSDKHIPLGIPANAELRQWRVSVHHVFDAMWRYKLRISLVSKNRARSLAYQWLSKRLGIEIEKCHIAFFTIEQCKKAYNICLPYARVLAHRSPIHS